MPVQEYNITVMRHVSEKKLVIYCFECDSHDDELFTITLQTNKEKNSYYVILSRVKIFFFIEFKFNYGSITEIF